MNNKSYHIPWNQFNSGCCGSSLPLTWHLTDQIGRTIIACVMKHCKRNNKIMSPCISKNLYFRKQLPTHIKMIPVSVSDFSHFIHKFQLTIKSKTNLRLDMNADLDMRVGIPTTHYSDTWPPEPGGWSIRSYSGRSPCPLHTPLYCSPGNHGSPRAQDHSRTLQENIP